MMKLNTLIISTSVVARCAFLLQTLYVLSAKTDLSQGKIMNGGHRQ